MKKHPLQVILEATERSVFAHQGMLAVSLVPEALGSLIADVMDELLLVDPRRTSSDGDNAAKVVLAFRNMRILRNDPLVVFFPGVPFVDSETRS